MRIVKIVMNVSASFILQWIDSLKHFTLPCMEILEFWRIEESTNVHVLTSIILETVKALPLSHLHIVIVYSITMFSFYLDPLFLLFYFV